MKKAEKKDDYYKVKNLKKRLDESCVTAGSTADDNYSLTLQVFDNKPCLCVHKWEKVVFIFCIPFAVILMSGAYVGIWLKKLFTKKS